MSEIILKEVVSKKDLKTFVSFCNKLYAKNKFFVPDLISDEMSMFIPKKNPAYEYCETKLYLAYINGEVVGRIAGIYNKAHIEKTKKKQLRFSRFDTIDNFEVTKALFKALEDWAKELGLDSLIGPIGFCDFDKQGMLIEGFEELDMFVTIYNAPYYFDHLTKLGFVKDADWIEFQVFPPTEPNERLQKLTKSITEKYGFRFHKHTKRSQLKKIIPDFFNIVQESYAHLYGVVPLTDKQIKKYTKQFYPLVNLEYFYDVRNKNDEMIGFGLLLPSLSRALQSCKGKLFPFGFIKILRALKHEKNLDCYLIGVKPEYQNRGVNAIILNEAINTAIRKGIIRAETGPELELNELMKAQWKLFNVRQHKRRRCFIYNFDSKE